MRTPIVVASVLGFLAVALGAFGAHGLKAFLDALPDGATRLAWWHTATQYQALHALLLVGVGALAAVSPSFAPAARRITIAVLLGALLFCGSLMAMTLTGIRALGAITPLGGVSFLAAWAQLFWHFAKNDKRA